VEAYLKKLLENEASSHLPLSLDLSYNGITDFEAIANWCEKGHSRIV